MPPTPQQLAAREHTTKNPKNLGVQARAGTGKSSTIEDMVKTLGRRDRALVVAFGKDIADAMRPRVPRWVDVKTLHALGFGAIQRARGVSLTPDKNRLRDISQQVVPESPLYTRRVVAATVARLASVAMNHLAVEPKAIEPLVDAYDIVTDPQLKPAQYAVWAAEMLAQCRRPAATISFDEMVFLPAIEDVFCGPYDFGFLDEMQDSNPAQKRLFMNALADGAKAVVVYDDRQCIYRFRGASEEAVDDFVAALDAEVLPLTVCFRCPRRVVTLAAKIVEDFEACDAAPEGRVTWETEEELLAKIRPGHTILARTNFTLSRMCLRLAKKGIRARIIGKDYAEKFQQVLDLGPLGPTSDFLVWLNEYQAAECDRLVALGEESRAEELVESLDTIRELSEGTKWVQEIVKRISDVFVDPKKGEDDGAFVKLMTAHKAKGLQWPDVWVMESSYRMKTVEDENLYYVSITRTAWSRDYPGHLRLVQSPRRDGKWPASIAKTLLPSDLVELWQSERS